MELNKPLYSFSYVCFTGGAAGLVLTSFYILVDVHGWRLPTLLFQWMGMNALLMYTLVACGILPAALKGFYWGSPDNNLVTWIVQHGPWHYFQGLKQHQTFGVQFGSGG
jgi:heparan-alpha-glucosaminide N-acetyltransferase